MRLKKILLPIFLGVALVMASLVSFGGEIKGNGKGYKSSVGAISVTQEHDTVAQADGNLFNIVTYDDLEYTGSAQTIMTITPTVGSLYYRVVAGEYMSSNAVTSSNYTSYSSVSAGETATITATEAGTHTVYYYLPATGSTDELASATSVTILPERDSNLFEVTPYDNLTYTGSAQRILSITPYTGDVYYVVQAGTYIESYANHLAYNYPDYSKGSAGTTTHVTATKAGTYTVYYYIPSSDDYKEVSSSATITIDNVSANLTINPNGGSYKGSTSNTTVSQEANSSYAIQTPTKAGSNETWSGGHKVLNPVALDNQVMEFDGVDDYIALGRDYMYEDKLFVSVEAYMDDWAEYCTLDSYGTTMRLLSCTEAGGWNFEPAVAGDAGYPNSDYISFAIYDAGSNQYRPAYSTTTKWADLSAGWHTFVGSFDGEYARLYVDGQLLGVSSRFVGNIGYNTVNQILVGVEANNTASGCWGGYFKGKMRNVYIANASVSTDSIYSPAPTDSVGYSGIHIMSGTSATTVTASWATNTYTVRFDAHGGTGTMADQTFTYGVEKALSTNAYSYENFKFAGWTTENYDINEIPTVEYTNGQGVLNLSSNNGEVVTLYAVWLSQYYFAHVYEMTTSGSYATTASYNITLSGAAGTSMWIKAEAYRLPSVYNGGFELDYAKDMSGNTLTADTYVDVANNNATTIKFYLKRASYTLTFDANGGSVTETSRNLKYEQAYGTLPTPTRTGYTFDSWIVDREDYTDTAQTADYYVEDVGRYVSRIIPRNEYSSTYFEIGNIIHFDITLSGTPTSIIYLDINDATIDTSNYTISGNRITGSGVVMANLNLDEITRYSFLDIEYTASSQLTATINYFAQEFTTKNVATSTTAMGRADTVLKAQWIANSYTATFDANGGSVSPTTKTITYDSTYGDLPTPTRPGYKFEGWELGSYPTVTSGSAGFTFSADGRTITLTSALDDNYFRIGHPAVAGVTYRVSFDCAVAGDNDWYYGFYFYPDDIVGRNKLVNGRNVVEIVAPSDSDHLTWDDAQGSAPNDLFTITNITVVEVGYITADTIVNNANDVILVAHWTQIEPTIEVSASDDNIVYGSESSTLTATVTHDLSKQYQWYRSTESDFTPSADTLIAGATDYTYVHNPKDADAHTWYYKCVATVNYDDDPDLSVTSEQVAITVIKSDNTFQLTFDTDMVYNGEEQVLVELIDNDGISNNVYYSINKVIDSTNTGTTALPTAVDAGDYTIYFHVPASTNYNAISGNINVSIAKKANLFEMIKPQGLEYNGTEQVLLEIIDNNEVAGDVYYYIALATDTTEPEFSEYTNSGLPTKADAGDYKVYFYVPSNTNYEEIYGSASVSIDRAINTFEAIPAQDLVYNGREQVLLEVIDNDGIDNNVYYNIGTELNKDNYLTTSTATTSLPTKKLDGTYLVYYYVPQTTNFYEMSGFAEVSIAPKSTTLSINPNGGAWGGNSDISTYTNNNGATMNIEDPTRAGYTFTGWTVNYFDVNDFVEFAAADAVYPEYAPYINENGELVMNCESFGNNFYYVDILPGEYRLSYWAYSDTNDITTGLYLDSFNAVTGYVNKSISLTVESSERRLYSGSITINDNCFARFGIISYFTGDTYLDVILLERTDGSVLVNKVFTFDTTDIELIANWEMIPPTVEISTDTNTVVYNKTVANLTATCDHALDKTYQWHRSTVSGFTPSSDTAITNAINSKYTHNKTTTVAGTYYYKCVVTVNGVSAVSDQLEIVVKKQSNVFELVYDQELTYNGNAQTLLQVVHSNTEKDAYYSIGDKLDSTNFSTLGSTTLPTGTNAGNYTVYFYVDSSDTMEAIAGKITITIAPRENTFEFVTYRGLVYNGRAQVLAQVFDSDGIDNNIYYSTEKMLDASNYMDGSTALPTGTQDGAYLIYFYAPASDNYKELCGFAENEIAVKYTDLTVNPNGGVWNGSADKTVINNYNGQTVTIADPTRAGYTFTGWTVNYFDVNDFVTFYSEICVYEDAGMRFTEDGSVRWCPGTGYIRATEGEGPNTIIPYVLDLVNGNYTLTYWAYNDTLNDITTGIFLSSNGDYVECIDARISSTTDAQYQNILVVDDTYQGLALGWYEWDWVTVRDILLVRNDGSVLVDGVFTFDTTDIELIANWTEKAPEVSISCDTTSIVYGEEDATFTAVGVHDLTITYQWYRSTESGFTPSADTLINGATNEIFVHEADSMDVDTYYYVCIASVDFGDKILTATSNELSLEVLQAENLFSMNVAQGLIYNGLAQELLEVKPTYGVVYYSVGADKALNADNYDEIGYTTLPTATDAGLHTVNFFVPSDTNYKVISGKMVVEIARTENTFEVITPQGLVYSGQPQTLAEVIDANNDVDGVVYYSIKEKVTSENYTNTDIASTALPTGTNSGDYTIYFYVPQTTNYYELSSIAYNTIAPKYTTLTINPNGGMWNGTSNISTVTDRDGAQVEIADPTRAGYDFVDWTYINTDTEEEITTELLVEGKYTYALDNVTFVANWAEKAPTITISCDTTSIVYAEDDATFTAVGVHDLTITYQWYRSTESGFTPSADTLINGATNEIFVHEADSMDVDTYYYVCIASVDFGDKVLSATSNELTLEVLQTENLFTMKTSQGLVYNGLAQELLTVTPNYGVVYYSVGVDKVLTADNYDEIGYTTLPTAINAGDHTVNFYVPEDTNYKAINGSVVVSIERADNTFELITPPDLVYNAKPQVLAQVIGANNDEDGVVYYSTSEVLNSTNYTNTTISSSELPTGTNSGDYTVYFYVPQTTNYYELSGVAYNTIAPRYTTLTINPNGGVWNGTTEVSEFTDRDGAEMTIADPTRAGYDFVDWTYINTDTEEEITDELLVEGKYTYALDNVTFVANWTEKAPTVEISCDVDNITYNFSEATFTATATHDLPVTYQWYRSTINGFEPSEDNAIKGATGATYVHESTETNAGTYYYVCIVSVDFGDKVLRATSEQLTLVVNKAENTFVMNVAQGLMYNGTAQTLLEIIDSDGIDNNVFYSIDKPIDATNTGSTDLPTRVDAGSYDVYFYVPESTNYKAITGKVTVDIGAKQNSFSVITGQNLVYNGLEQQLLEVIDYDEEENNVYYAFGVELTKDNYQDTTIASTTKPAKTNAGTYEIYFYVPSTGNYLEISGRMVVSIERAENIFELVPAQDLVYTGEPQNLLEVIDSNNDENGEVRYSIGTELHKDNYTDTNIASTSIPQGTDAQTYEIYFYVPQTTNYYELKGSTEVAISYKETTLTIDPNGGIWNEKSDISEFKQNNGTTLEIADATREGYTFDGWDITEGGLFDDETNTYTFGIINVTMTAKWKGIEYTITVVSDTSTTEVTYTSDNENAQEIAITNTDKTGYTFAGWLIDPNTSGADATVSDTANESGEYTLTIPAGSYGNITVTAQFTANTYEVAFNGNGATSGEMANQVFTYDTPQALNENAYSKTGYSFGGWATTETGEATYADKQEVENLTTSGVYELFAVWTANQYTVSFNSNGGSDCDDITVTYDSEYGELPIPTKDGYVFENWYLDEGLTSVVTSDTTVATASDHTLYANWNIEPYELTLDYQGGTEQFLTVDNNSVSGTFETAEQGIGAISGTGNLATSTNAFNGDKSVTFRIDTVGENEYDRRYYVTTKYGVGKYLVSAYVSADANSTIDVYAQESVDFDYLGDGAQNVTLQANVWSFVTFEFEITSALEECAIYLLFYANDLGVNYFVDDIKVMRVDGYVPTTVFDYDVEDEEVKLPYAVKAGYTFLGWNTMADGTGEYVTTYGGGMFGDTTFYAIYELSRPTVTTSVDNATITYGVDDATISTAVNTDGVAVDTITYQWYYDTNSDFSTIQLIEGATNATFVHTSTLRDVGTYYYRCVVSVTKDGITTETSVSTSVTVEVSQGENTLEISMDGYTYNGEISTPQVVTNVSGAEVTFYYTTTNEATGGTEWINMTSTTLDAGTYYIYATTPATTNYKAGVSDVVEFVVSTATIEIQTVVDAGTTKEENGYNFTMTSELDADGIIFQIGPTNIDATLTYWIGDDGEKTEVALTKDALHKFARTDAGKDIYNYTITATNYTTISGTIELSIAVQTVEVEWVVSDSYTYNGENQSASVRAYITGVDGNEIDCEVTFTVSGTEVEFINAGTYIATATLTGADANNYTLSEASIELVMNKFAVTITAEDKTMTYSESAPTYTYTESVDTPDGYEVTYNLYEEVVGDTETTTTDVTGQELTLSVGIYKIVATSTLNEDNYAITYVDGELTITAKLLTKPSVINVYAYNGSEQTVELVDFDEATMEIVSGDKATDAGTYSVEIKLIDAENYMWADSTIDNVVLEWTIAKFDLSNATIADIADQPFTGSAVTPTPEVTTEFATLINETDFVYGYENNIDASEEAKVIITAVEDSNYTGTNYKLFTIAGAFVDMPVVGTNPTYDGTEKSIDIPSSDLYEIVSGGTYTDAGTYEAVVRLTNPTNYTWRIDENTTTKDDLTIVWQILKADVELSVDTTELVVRRGETETRDVTITLDYVGNLNGQDLTLTYGENSTGSATITASTIEENKSTITVTPETSGLIYLQIQYTGDNNHNASEVVGFNVFMPAIRVDLIIVDGVGGSAKLNGVIEGTTSEVEIGSEITFDAIPNSGYGFISYNINHGDTIYVPSATDLNATFTSPVITINDDLLGNVIDKANNTITIELKFEEIVTIDVNMDSTGTGAIAHQLVTKYGENEVAHVYKDNKLTVFKNSTIMLDVEAQYDSENDQYYVVNKIAVGDNAPETINMTETSVTKEVNGLIDEDGTISAISIQAAKVYEAEDRVITDGANTVATVNVEVVNSYEAVNIKKSETEQARYVVEDAIIYYNIVETNENYDFLGMKVNGVVTLKGQLDANEWTYDSTTTTRTWNAQEYTKELSTAEPVMLERWYTVGNESGRVVDVEVISGVNAKLVNTDIGYSYTLSNNVFATGEEPLYAGNWMVEVENATITNYTITVQVYKGEAYTEYAKDETFTVDSSVTKVVITISQTNG